MRILVIGLSNVGDGVLMSPVIARLAEGYPQARVTVLVGERARALFAGDPRVHELMTLDGFAGWSGRLRLIGLIWRMRPDLLIDLRHTALPLVWKPWRCWRYFWPVPKHLHMRERHLWRLKIQGNFGLDNPQSTIRNPQCLDRSAIWISPDDQRQVTTLASRWGLAEGKPLVVVCPGARSHTKRWYTDRFAAVADGLIEEAGAEVVLTGEPE
ncbi:MAG: glycosyltransferase family 9 protein, partial [Candidatus Omnitrophica bacterium]|nr:glycosyltransferase family 9 protein [Candidatus Omnitrophota bacterium]